jgi:hypothetical protein
MQEEQTVHSVHAAHRAIVAVQMLASLLPLRTGKKCYHCPALAMGTHPCPIPVEGPTGKTSRSTRDLAAELREEV